MDRIPMTANFELVSAAVVDEVTMKQGTAVMKRTMPLVLKPRKDIEVLLANGQPLHSVNVHLTLVLGTSVSTAVARELGDSDLGYLIQIQGEGSEPFVHGSVVWTDPQPPTHLLNPALAHSVRMTLANVPIALDWTEAFAWAFGREHILRIEILTISSFPPQE